MGFDLPPVTRALLFANVAIYLLQMLIGNWLIACFALWPLGPSTYTNVPGFEPWQLVTYGFLHDPDGLGHIASNMFGLLMFGGAIERTLGARPFTIYYFACLIGAALTQLAVMRLFPAGFFPTLGASGAIFGILLAFGMLYPHERLLVYFAIPMPAWLVVTAYGAIELFLGVTNRQQGVAHFAHLGGLAMGFMMIEYWRGKLPLKPRRILMR